MIAIVDYGLGNIKAFANVYKNLGMPFVIASRADDFKGVTRIILPGVGAFDQAMERIERSGLRMLLNELVLHRKLPLLGICVGMQILACSSEEGTLSGLGWVDGVVKRFHHSESERELRLPHMGWNSIRPKKRSELFRELNDGARFYFLHSYYFRCHDERDSIAKTEYGMSFDSVVNAGNIYGAQFHPEKSHRNGIQLLKNFGVL